MKRLLVATLLALMIHAGLMALNFEWFTDKTIKLPKAKAVTVTIAYSPPSPKPVLNNIKKEPVKRQKIEPIKKIKPPEKLKQPLSVRTETEVKPTEAAITPIKTAIAPDNTDTIFYPLKGQKDDASEVGESKLVSDNEGKAKHSGRDSDSPAVAVTREASPLYKTNPPPLYPQLARKRGYKGIVVLSVFVSENGRVKNLSVFKSCGYRILDDAAQNAVKNWLFEPGIKGNKKAEMWVRVPIRFELK